MKIKKIKFSSDFYYGNSVLIVILSRLYYDGFIKIVQLSLWVFCMMVMRNEFKMCSVVMTIMSGWS